MEIFTPESLSSFIISHCGATGGCKIRDVDVYLRRAENSEWMFWGVTAEGHTQEEYEDAIKMAFEAMA